MDENETKLGDVEQLEMHDKKSSNVILFSDYAPSDILGIVRVLQKTTFQLNGFPTTRLPS